jgi:hypothetical protein
MAFVAGRWGTRTCWFGVLAISAFFVWHASRRVIATRSNVESRAVTPSDAMQPIYRDAAVAIRQSQPTGEPIVLSSPNASTAIGYFGRIKTIGTLYWENLEGLEAASRIFSASTDDQARALLQARGITHVAMFSKDNFLEEYDEFAHFGAPLGDSRNTFGRRLLQTAHAPAWLRPIPFRLSAAASQAGLVARIFQVVPDQTEFDADWASAIAEVADGNLSSAEKSFHAAISRIARSRQADLYANAASESYKWGAHRLAVRLLDSALSKAPTPAFRENQAWIMATSIDDEARNGVAALLLAEPIAKANPTDETALDVYAAALAETGRFEDAVRIAERLEAIAAKADHRDGVLRAQARLSAYRARRPWRQ